MWFVAFAVKDSKRVDAFKSKVLAHKADEEAQLILIENELITNGSDSTAIRLAIRAIEMVLFLKTFMTMKERAAILLESRKSVSPWSRYGIGIVYDEVATHLDRYSQLNGVDRIGTRAKDCRISLFCRVPDQAWLDCCEPSW